MNNKLSFNVFDCDQRTDKWNRWRHRGIGASEAAAILGENRFRSEESVFQEKLGPAFGRESNFQMQDGEDCEPSALRDYIAKKGAEFSPKCLESKGRPWMHASVDGISWDFSGVVEIKCGVKTYSSMVRYGEIAPWYHPQLQHILAVTGLPSIDYWCWRPGCSGILVMVPRHEKYIARLISIETAFWERLEEQRSVRTE